MYYKEKIIHSFRIHYFEFNINFQLFSLLYSRVAQAIVLSSQTDKFTWATAFSHYFGLKQDKKTKIENPFAFFHLAQAVQSFTT